MFWCGCFCESVPVEVFDLLWSEDRADMMVPMSELFAFRRSRDAQMTFGESAGLVSAGNTEICYDV